MLQALFPQVQGRYSSLPLLGSIIDSFATWLAERGYRKSTLRVMLRPMVQIDRWLRRHDVERISDLDVDILEACWTTYHPRSSNIGGVIRALAKYLDSLGVLQHSQVDPQTPSEQLVSAYAEHLDKVRGFSQSSIRNRLRTASQFLGHIRHDAQSPGVHGVTPSDIESFVRQRGHELTRASLQQLVAHLRGFLRFLAMVGKVSPSLAEAIDTPRIYRREKLPRSLPWETVKALLESIDRSTGDGLRDYTMLLLIAAYGLRVSEVAALTLDGIHWRQRWLQVPQRKSRSPLPLPLTDTVGSALVHYLREGRPKDVTSRHLFLRSRAPTEHAQTTGDTRELHSNGGLDYGGETREVGAIDVNIRSRSGCVKQIKRSEVPQVGRRRERGLCGIVERRFFQIGGLMPGLNGGKTGGCRRSANEAFGMSVVELREGSGAERW